MILIDTDVLIQYYRGDQEIEEQLRKIGASQMLVSDVTKGEMYQGVRNKTELRAIKELLSEMSRMPVTPEISGKAVELVETYGLSHNCHISDALIAATALLMDYPLFTLNIKDFRYIPNLNLYAPNSVK